MKQTPANVLLLCNSHPDSTGIAEIFLRKLAKYYPSGKLFRFSTVNRRFETPQTGVWRGGYYELGSAPVSSIPLWSSLTDWKIRNQHVPKLLQHVLKLVADYKIDSIWSVLTSGSMIYLTSELIQQTNLPVHAMVWDVPQYFISNLRLDYYTRQIWLKKFEEILRNSLTIAVASEGMQADFAQKYGVQSIPIPVPADIDDIDMSTLCTANPEDSETIKIGFAGSLYAKDAWNALLSTIDSDREIYKGKSIQLVFWGRFPKYGAKKSTAVQLQGTVDHYSVIKALRSCHIAYLPYSFAKRWEYVARTSFPGKLTTYLCAGLPVLYHGPITSTPADFFHKYPVGPCCHSTHSNTVKQALQLAIDPTIRLKSFEARSQALSQEFSESKTHTQFNKFMNLA